MKELFWGTDVKFLRAYRDGKLVAKVENRFTIILPNPWEQEGGRPKEAIIEGVSLPDGIYTIFVAQQGFNDSGSRLWKSTTLSDAQVKTVKGESGEFLKLDNIKDWTEGNTKDKPDPREMLGEIGIEVDE